MWKKLKSPKFFFFWTYFHNFLCFLAHTQVLSFCSRKRSTLWSTLGYREVGGELYYSIAQYHYEMYYSNAQNHNEMYYSNAQYHYEMYYSNAQSHNEMYYSNAQYHYEMYYFNAQSRNEMYLYTWTNHHGLIFLAPSQFPTL